MPEYREANDGAAQMTAQLNYVSHQANKLQRLKGAKLRRSQITPEGQIIPKPTQSQSSPYHFSGAPASLKH